MAQHGHFFMLKLQRGKKSKSKITYPNLKEDKINIRNCRNIINIVNLAHYVISNCRHLDSKSVFYF